MISRSIFSLYALSVGKFELTIFKEAASEIGLIYIVTFLLVFKVFLYNIFTAIVYDHYKSVRK